MSNPVNSKSCIHPHPTHQELPWYAVQTRSRHEKLVAHQLETRGLSHFLPIVVESHRWSDRRKRVEVPLFPGYVFVRAVESNEGRVEVLRTHGVVRFVGSSPTGTAIPDTEIESVRTLVSGDVPWNSYPFLKTGQRVRIRGGAIDGLEGILLRRDGEDRLVVSIDAIQRSLSISIKGYDLEAM
ncbi:MAG: UpxY family transcription antiterminator [Acidobacteria bacterium]|nr:UpxY family transcription antiterminator [Acidobacteriota bacterium]